MRESEEQIDLDLFTVRHGEPVLAGRVPEETGWGRDGLPGASPESEKCFAKEARDYDTGTTRYFVKYSLAGPTAGQMLDPTEEGDLGRRGDWTANGRFAFRAVPKAAFDLYVQFLKTLNPAYLRQASREAADA